MSFISRARMAGVSLIELMIAIAIGAILMIGLVQLFGASRAAYQLSEGMARVQENGRFAMDFLQRDLRMAGHFGCVNDQAHMMASEFALATTFAGTHSAIAQDALRFDISIQGFEAEGTEPGRTVNLAEPPDAAWGDDFDGSDIDAATTGNAAGIAARVPGSDIIVLRFLAPEGVPVTEIGGADPQYPEFSFEEARWDVLRGNVTNPGLFGVGDCLSATLFQATGVDHSTPTSVVRIENGGLNQFPMVHVYTPGQTVLYRAESLIYYVGTNAEGTGSLYRVRYTVAPGGAGAYGPPEEMVSGIENMQILYGFDRQTDTNRPPTGFIDNQSVALDSADPERWLRLGAVQIGLLAVSDPATAPQAQDANKLMSMGVAFDTPNDTRLRSVYQSTIAVRNRLYGN